MASIRMVGAVRNSSAWIVAIAACLVASSARSAPTVTLTRLACGEDPAAQDVSNFSDTYAYSDFKFRLTYSCYLIRHGSDYMLWDTGNPLGKGAASPKLSLIDQLRALRLRPDDVTYVGISHYHMDHTGQLGAFPQSKLLIGKGDWDALSAANPLSGMDAATASNWRAPFTHWLSQGGRLEALTGDKDVFGDGTVIMLSTPGHTPGHHSLLVRLGKTGNVLITGDLTHFRENYENNQVPTWNTSRADTLASLDRFKQIARNLKALVIIQHDPRDVGKLPPFPAAAD
jgi:N-acyl homoserine lactone hydrolase